MPKFVPERSSSPAAPNEAISRAGSRWIVRSDRGLIGTERAEFDRWLAADVRHRKAMASSSVVWGLLDRAPSDFVMPDDKRVTPRFTRKLIFSMAAAAAIAICIAGGWHLAGRKVDSAANVASREITPRTLLLSDGTLVSLNSGAEVSEQFTASRRRVVLLRGEAHFNVKKNAAWPFAVRAGNSEVVAVGTAFDVELRSKRVEIVVTEGKVRVASNVTHDDVAFLSTSGEGCMVRAGQQALVSRKHFLAPLTVEVMDSDPQNLARILAWKNPLTTLTGATLGELAADFNNRIGYRLDFADPEIASLRIGGRFRVDDVEDFVRLLADNFGLEAKHVGQNETILRLRK